MPGRRPRSAPGASGQWPSVRVAGTPGPCRRLGELPPRPRRQRRSEPVAGVLACQPASAHGPPAGAPAPVLQMGTSRLRVSKRLVRGCTAGKGKGLGFWATPGSCLCVYRSVAPRGLRTRLGDDWQMRSMCPCPFSRNEGNTRTDADDHGNPRDGVAAQTGLGLPPPQAPGRRRGDVHSEHSWPPRPSVHACVRHTGTRPGKAGGWLEPVAGRREPVLTSALFPRLEV